MHRVYFCDNCPERLIYDVERGVYYCVGCETVYDNYVVDGNTDNAENAVTGRNVPNSRLTRPRSYAKMSRGRVSRVAPVSRGISVMRV